MDFSTLMQQATANQEYTKKKYDEIKRINKEEEARRKEREEQLRERKKRKIELALAEERARKIKPPPLVPPSETSSTSSSKHATNTCKSHVGKNSKKEKPSSVSCGTTVANKTVPPVSVKGHAPKHKASSTTQLPPQTTKQPASKPLDFKQLMEIASKQGSGNKSKELVKQCRLKQQTKLSSTRKPPVATSSSKPVKPVSQAGTKKPQPAVPSKQVSTHKGVAGNKVTLASSAKQRPSSATAATTTTTTKKLSEASKVNCKAKPKPSGVKLKTGSFYQSSAVGCDWSDMKKTIKRPQQQLQQRRLNGFNVSGSWINELGLNKLPTDLDSDYEDDDMSDFVASDDEGIDEDCEDYSAAIRDIFGYDRSRFGNDDTEVMESSYSQQQFEEKRSARIGKAEDEEDIRKELEEMRRKKRKK